MSTPPQSPLARPWVTILTPVANGWQHLKEAALSVFLQRTQSLYTTPFQWEWWIGVNGHGPTGGEALALARDLQAIAAQHIQGGTVHVINLTNVKGKVAALHALTEYAKGEWLAVLDCDDTWEPCKLLHQKIASERAAAEAGVIGTWTWYFGELESGGPELPAGWISPELLRRQNPIINSSALLRREYALWRENWRGLDDYDLWIRLTKLGVRMYNVPERLVHHRIHRDSAFNQAGVQDVAGLLAASWPPPKEEGREES